MIHVPIVAGAAFMGMGYAVWRGFNPRGKSEQPGPHNGWRTQDGAKK